jgi:hypothetical protein
MEETMRVQTISKLARLTRIKLADPAARIIAVLAAPVHDQAEDAEDKTVCSMRTPKGLAPKTLVRTAGLEPAREVTPEGF